MNELDGHTLYVIRRHVGLKHIYGEAPEAVESAKIYFREQIEALEPKFRGAGEYLFGDTAEPGRYPSHDMPRLGGRGGHSTAGVGLGLSRKRVTSRPAYGVARHRNDPATIPPPEALLCDAAIREKLTCPAPCTASAFST